MRRIVLACMAAALFIIGGVAQAVVDVSPSRVKEAEPATIAFTVRDDRPNASIKTVAIWPPGRSLPLISVAVVARVIRRRRLLTGLWRVTRQNPASKHRRRRARWL